ncbi:MAG: OmpA family protein [Desulfuromonadaceae bacterium]|nr:OmpA family protein [Desulfuromonadaceae bacterium]
MKVLQFCILIISAAYLAGCATVAPTELVDARSAYQTASVGPAQQLAPAELHKAELALNEAEQSFLKESDSNKTKDLAYVAQRKSQQAGAVGAIAAAKAAKEHANADFRKQQTAIMEQGKRDLSDSEKQTAAAQAELARQAEIKAAKEKTDAEAQRQQASIEQGKRDAADAEKRAAVTQAELDKQAALNTAKATADAEKQAALDAAKASAAAELKASELRTAAAMAELAAIASLKEEERGLVLTLSGSILFRSADSTLMPAAQVKLDQVTKALLAIHPRSLVVEGHTDSQGSNTYNQALSQRRADAVRNYLVQKGYPANQVQAHGQGEGSPVAENNSAEGRANNRRVEIVIQRDVQASK